MEVITRITIDRPVEDAWAVLADFGSYGAWNPVVTSMKGRAQAGAKCKMTIKGAPNLPALPIGIKMVTVNPNQELAWQGGVSGVIQGTHYFRLTPKGDDQCELVHGEKFTGVVTKLLWGKMEGELETTYNRLNEAFKARVEG